MKYKTREFFKHKKFGNPCLKYKLDDIVSSYCCFVCVWFDSSQLLKYKNKLYYNVEFNSHTLHQIIHRRAKRITFCFPINMPLTVLKTRFKSLLRHILIKLEDEKEVLNYYEV